MKIHYIIIFFSILLSCKSFNKELSNKNLTKDSILDASKVNLGHDISPDNDVRTNETGHFQSHGVFFEQKILGDFFYASTDSLKENDLRFIPPSILLLIRNEIFARHGYKFKNKELLDYFKNKSWYTPRYDKVDTLLTDIEKYNINVLLSYEKKNKEITKEELFNIYLNDCNNAPKILCFLFDCPRKYMDYGSQYLGGFSKEQIFKNSSEFKYVLSGWYGGCDQCVFTYNIEVYSLKGEFLHTIELNLSYSYEVKISIVSDSLIIFENYDRHVSRKYKDSTSVISRKEEMDEDVQKYYEVDTIKTKVFMDKNGRILIK